MLLDGYNIKVVVFHMVFLVAVVVVVVVTVDALD
jgi:hypothetical protein